MSETATEKRRPIWPWILLGLGILALLYFLFFNNSRVDEVNTLKEKSDLTEVHENNSTVNNYVSFVRSDTTKMTLSHAFSSEAITKLVAAVSAMAGDINYDVKGDLEKARASADSITKNPFETTHADNIRKAADILGNILQNMQQAKYPAMSSEVAESRRKRPKQ